MPKPKVATLFFFFATFFCLLYFSYQHVNEQNILNYIHIYRELYLTRKKRRKIKQQSSFAWNLTHYIYHHWHTTLSICLNTYKSILTLFTLTKTKKVFFYQLKPANRKKNSINLESMIFSGYKSLVNTVQLCRTTRTHGIPKLMAIARATIVDRR